MEIKVCVACENCPIAGPDLCGKQCTNYSEFIPKKIFGAPSSIRTSEKGGTHDTYANKVKAEISAIFSDLSWFESDVSDKTRFRELISRGRKLSAVA